MFNKFWPILQNDPHLSTALPMKSRLTFRRAKSLKSYLALSRIRIVGAEKIDNVSDKPPGSSSCENIRCKNCINMTSYTNEFCSTVTKQTFKIKTFIDCSSSFGIYMLECPCKLQYVGRTMMTLRNCMNKLRTMC